MMNEKGQSTIEFIFTFCFGVSVIFMVFNTSLNYCTGYLVHYATYMASRTYLTTDSSLGTQDDPSGSLNGSVEKAQETYSKYMLGAFKVGPDKFEVNQIGDGAQPSEYLTVGARTTFDMRVDAIGQVAGETTLELVSESFLGHEPTRAQCAQRTCFAITNQTSCNPTMDITLYDDGC